MGYGPLRRVAVKRGDLITVAVPRDYGKPGPALVIQSHYFPPQVWLTIPPLTSDLREMVIVR